MVLTHQRYDTALVCLYALGKAHLVPEHVRKRVPHSTASAWRKLDTASLVGYELRALHQQALDLQETLAKYRRLRTTVLTLVKVWMSVAPIVLPALHKAKAHRGRVVEAVQELMRFMPRGRALRLAGISASAFSVRLTEVKQACGLSPLGRCFGRHPLQLCVREVQVIKDLFADRALHCWAAASLYYHAKRSGSLHLSLSTFYHYVTLLGLKRRIPKARPKIRGIVSSKPNEYLHIDTTFYPIAGEQKVAIALVSDNFSKAVLGRSASLSKHAPNIVAALKETIATIRQHHPQELHGLLITDGGGENHAEQVEELLITERPPELLKLIALKDIAYSNSPIEAINKILKRYLRYYDPQTLEAVMRVVDLFIRDYNTRRPHVSLKGLTPMEKYIHPSAQLDLCTGKAEALENRIAENRAMNCAFQRTTPPAGEVCLVGS